MAALFCSLQHKPLHNFGWEIWHHVTSKRWQSALRQKRCDNKLPTASIDPATVVAPCGFDYAQGNKATQTIAQFWAENMVSRHNKTVARCRRDLAKTKNMHLSHSFTNHHKFPQQNTANLSDAYIPHLAKSSICIPFNCKKRGKMAYVCQPLVNIYLIFLILYYCLHTS